MHIELWEPDESTSSPCDPLEHQGNQPETWKPVVGYEGLYEVSSIGRLRRSSASRMAASGYVIKPRLTHDGYVRYSLSKRQRYRTITAHRLVALAFLGPPPFVGAQVAHYDGVKTNNAVSNLRWASAAENQADKRRHGVQCGAQHGERHHNAKLTVGLVSEMRRQAAKGDRIIDVARRFGVNKLTAYEAIVGITWSSVTDPGPLGQRRSA